MSGIAASRMRETRWEEPSEKSTDSQTRETWLIHKAFESHVQERGEAVAIAFEDRFLTYHALNREATRAAHALLQAGVGPGNVVAILMERSPEMVMGILAILKTGAIYLPLDLDIARRRLAYILEDAGAAWLVKTAASEDPVSQGKVHLLYWENLCTVDPKSDEFPDVPAHSPAYIIYTSGSTGKPKGAMLPHQGVTNMAKAQAAVLGVDPCGRILQFYSFAFDAAVFETYMALLNGATLVLERRDTLMQGPGLTRLLRAKAISSIQLPPVVLEQLEAENLPALRSVLVGGEVYPSHLIEKWAAHHVLFNVYGPTEATCWATVHRLEKARPRLPIGRPIAHVEIRLLDERGLPVARGKRGEIYIGGVGVGLGYVAKPALTAERFLPDIWGDKPGSRLYRSGDMGRLCPNGKLDFTGRVDNQVKIRGYRVELGEIEAVLQDCTGVRRAAVFLWEQPQKILTAYVQTRTTGRRAQTVLRQRLCQRLKEKLPAYMVPSQIIMLDRFPLTANDKLDRGALPRPERIGQGRKKPAAPGGSLQAYCTEHLENLLDVACLNPDDSLLELGYHSLHAARLIAGLDRNFGVRLPFHLALSAKTPKELLLAVSAEKRGSHRRGRAPIPGRHRERAPLSWEQSRLWFLSLNDPEDVVFHLAFCYRIEGPLDLVAMETALARVVIRHDALRARFRHREGEPYQTVAAPLPFRLPAVFLDQVPAASRALTLQRWKKLAGRLPFDLENGPLFRVCYFHHGDGRGELIFAVHHIAFDGWSLGLLARDLAAYYGDALGHSTRLPRPLPCNYADYAAWQQRRAIPNEKLAFWRRKLAEPIPELALPADRTTNGIHGLGARRQLALPVRTVARLRDLAGSENATLYTALLALFMTWLHRVSGQHDLVAGTVTANRNHPDVQELVGFFVNMLPIRAKLEGRAYFREVVRAIRREYLQVLEHEIPFTKFVEAVNPDRSAPSTLIQTTFIYHNERLEAPELAGTKCEIEELYNQTAEFDLQLEWMERGNEVWGWLEYDTGRFHHATVARMARQLLTLAESVTETADRPIQRLTLLAEAERYQLLKAWNDTAADYAAPPSLPHWFAGRVTEHPSAPALRFEGRPMRYGALDALAERWAHDLRSRGVRPGAMVGLCLERSFEMVAGMLAIHKAGGAYVPFDPEYPAARLAYLFEDSGVALILTQERFLSLLSGFRGEVISLDRAWNDTSHQAAEPLPAKIGAAHPAYMIYTSGSTGLPKGAVISHGAIVNRLMWMQAAYGLNREDRVLQKTPYSFDVSVWEFFWPLVTGATLVLARPGGHRDSGYLARLIPETGVTTLHFVPSMLRLFLEEADVPALTTLKRVFCSGEALPKDLKDRFYQRVPAELHNLYGPTEAAVDVTAWPCLPGDEDVPIGRPIANIHIHILDAMMAPAPMGAAGELHIGGVGLAEGYRGRPELTAEKFVPNPFSDRPGERLYKTGDLVRYQVDGAVTYLGRIDFQIKLRGFRIELGEIESQLRMHPDIRDAAVVLAGGVGGEPSLAAFLAAEDPGIQKTLRDYLAEHLPEHMIPTHFVVKPSLPLSANGKLDRGALKRYALDFQVLAQDQNALGAEKLKPRTPLERKLAGIWQKVFGVDEIGIRDSFFTLGGHSLLATKLVMKVRGSFGVEFPLQAFFDQPTIEGMAQTLDRLLRRGVGDWQQINEPDLLAEAALEAEITPPRDTVSEAGPSGILLTGGTGFLGAYLLVELLRRTKVTVYCLVRASDDESGRRRIRANLQKYGLWNKGYARRIHALAGDLSRPLLGLNPDRFQRLARQIGAIYHNGAWVNFLEPYRRLKDPNVNGTREVLRLACTHRTKRVHYISSSSVYGTVGFFKGVKLLREDDDIRLGLGYGFNGYVQTKWVSEAMIWEAKRRGLPVTVFRCALVMGHSQTGITNARDFPSMMFKSCIQLGAFYDLEEKYDNFVPVDFAAAAVAHLSLQAESLGQAFHVVNPHHISYADLWKIVERVGYPMEKLTFPAWLRRFEAQAEENALFPLMPLYLDKISRRRLTIIELFQMTPFYDTTRVDRGLEGTGIICPPIDERLVGAWFRFYRQKGFLPPPAEEDSVQDVSASKSFVSIG